MLDFPELLAPARIVSGRISIDCSCLMDLKPETDIRVIPSSWFGRGFFGPAR
jgi:hypothetical protein